MNVLITGAANGLGLAASNYFATNNHTVFACDICKPKDKINIKGYKLDVTNIEEINILKEELIKKNIKIDVLINFAGIYDIGSFVEKYLNEIHKIMNINFLGPINVINILYPLLSKTGRIIIVTSELAPLDPLPFNGLYSVSKTALDSYSQSLRQELNLIGQKVITIRPGSFNTKLSRGSLDATEKLVNSTKLYKKQSDNFLRLVQKFMGTPKDPMKLSKVIYKASTVKKPKYVYKCNINMGLKLLSILPLKLQCYIIKKLLK